MLDSNQDDPLLPEISVDRLESEEDKSSMMQDFSLKHQTPLNNSKRVSRLSKNPLPFFPQPGIESSTPQKVEEKEEENRVESSMD